MSLLEVQAVSKAFGGIHALNTCSLSVEEGSITGLIGPNGSGKTTLFNVITGYEKVDTGTIRFGSHTITNAKPDKVFRLGIGRTFQLTRIFPQTHGYGEYARRSTTRRHTSLAQSLEFHP